MTLHLTLHGWTPHRAQHAQWGSAAVEQAVLTGERPRPVPRSFEDVLQSIDRLPRMFAEPDGSFVWRGEDPQPFQVDGLLVDGGPHVDFVELKGSAPCAQLQVLMSAVAGGQPAEQSLLLHLVQEGIYLSVTEFLRAWEEDSGC